MTSGSVLFFDGLCQPGTLPADRSVHIDKLRGLDRTLLVRAEVVRIRVLKHESRVTKLVGKSGRLFLKIIFLTDFDNPWVLLALIGRFHPRFLPSQTRVRKPLYPGFGRPYPGLYPGLVAAVPWIRVRTLVSRRLYPGLGFQIQGMSH